MPVYEYTCPKCGHFEREQRFSDPILKECPTCGSPAKKLFSRPAIVFKGSGWYKTDSRGPEPSGDSSSKSDDKKTTVSTPSTSSSESSSTSTTPSPPAKAD